MTVKELKEKIEGLPDEMKVGGSGHFGEYLECWDINITTVSKDRRMEVLEKILCISIEDAGEEPS